MELPQAGHSMAEPAALASTSNSCSQTEHLKLMSIFKSLWCFVPCSVHQPGGKKRGKLLVSFFQLFHPGINGRARRQPVLDFLKNAARFARIAGAGQDNVIQFDPGPA